MLLCRGYYTHYLHLLAIALACVLSIHHGHCFTLPVPKIDLSDKSYVLDMYLMFGDKFSYQAEEMHSAWQKRSKVYLRRYQKDKFDHNDSRLAATIHADSERLLLIDNLFVDPSCKRTDHDEVDELLKQTMLKGFDSGHLIGASRLMSFISANSEKFSQLSLSPEQQKDRVYKLIYEAKFNQNAANAFSIILFYHEEASQNFPNGVPRMISVTTSSGPLTTYMMVRYQPLKTGQVQGSTSSVESVDQYRYSQADEVTLDLFAVDRTLDCSKAILDEKDQSSHEQDNNALLASNSLRFSLHIRPVTSGSKEPQDLTAVYEPSLQNLRTEQHTKSRSFIKIMDFYDNHQYEIIRRHTLAGNSMLDRVFEPDQVDSCVVSKLNIYASNGTPYSLGQMLLGTNRLAYLGLARVRGIDTRVYQYHDCDFPIWWQHPVIYLDSSDQKNKIPFPLPKLRRERETMKKNAISITSVFYFTKPEGSSGKEEDLSKAKLLYIELLFRNDRTGAIISKTSSSVFDFDWGLPSSSPTGGGRYEDLFSLQNDCLADVDSGEYATIDLMLEAKLEQEQLDWLKDRTKRNLALLETLQLNLFINPISMLYDFESRLITGDAITIQGSREPLHPVSLEITTRTAARNDKVANLIYLGMTNVGDNFVEDTEWFVNFQLCQALVAHQKVNLMFAYRSNTGECLMFKSDILSAYDRDFDRLTEAIKVNDRASSGSEPKLDELYIIKHLNKAPYKIDRLKAASFDLKRSDNMLIYDPTRPYVSQSGSNATSRIKLDIKQVHVDRLDDEDNYELDELHLSGTNKFLGFGLVAEDEQNKLVEIRGTEDDGQTEEMSFEHCQTACLADLECRSFSVCHRQGETSCVLSSVSFSAPSIALQIMILADVEAKFGTKFSISVDQDEQEILKGINSTTKETTDSTSTSSSGSETIQLMKHGACELHNKLYRDLFKKFNLRLSRLSRRVIYPVAHVEQCSEICFMKTLNFLRETKSMFTTENAAPIDASKACDRFYYVDHETLALLEPERVEVFKKRLDLSTVHTETVGGYCVLDDSGGGDTTDYDSESLRHDDELFGQLESQRYEFDYLNLYSKQFGVSMLESPLSKKAKQALWESVKGFDAKNVADDEIPKPNENYGQQMYFNQDHGEHTSECAQECFWPFYRRAYPACRSFDSFVVINPKETTRKVCGFNSMTLASANAAHRSDLIRIGSDKQERISVRPMDTVRVWHYELRPGLVADSVEAMYKIQLAQDVKAAKAASAQVHIGGFNLFCCFVILMSLGVTIGITLNSRYLANNQKLHGDTSQLVVDDDRMDAAELAKVESGTVQQSNGQQEAASR